jgi:hypothetical protein
MKKSAGFPQADFFDPVAKLQDDLSIVFKPVAGAAASSASQS